jgi:broad specificity phosphatase PhoE
MSGQHRHYRHPDGSRDEDPLIYARPQLSLVPLRHTKIIHFIRHAQGFHNINHEDDIFDAHLTEYGWKQAATVGQHIDSLGSLNFRCQAVVTSPLTRTLETTAGIFGKPWKEGDGDPLFVGQTAAKGERAAQKPLTAINCCPPKIIVWEGCREHLGPNLCDKRRRISEVAPSFPAMDFSLCQSDKDALWSPKKEEKEAVKHRGLELARWLMHRPEREIAVVSHSVFLLYFMSNFGHSASIKVQGEMHRWFENCEMRTLVLSDESGVNQEPCPLHFHGGHTV